MLVGNTPPGPNFQFEHILGLSSGSHIFKVVAEWEGRPLNLLASFFFRTEFAKMFKLPKQPPMRSLMIDSGIFSAWKRGVKIHLGDYIAWAREHEDLFDRIVGIDMVNYPWLTYKNCNVMSDALGRPVMPVFHIGEDMKWLDKFCKDLSEHGVGLSCRFGEQPKYSWDFYARCFKRQPNCAFHSFGWISEKMLMTFPFASADSSTTLVRGPAWGQWSKTYGRLSIGHSKIKYPILREIDQALKMEDRINAKWKHAFAKTPRAD